MASRQVQHSLPSGALLHQLRLPRQERPWPYSAAPLQAGRCPPRSVGVGQCSEPIAYSPEPGLEGRVAGSRGWGCVCGGVLTAGMCICAEQEAMLQGPGQMAPSVPSLERGLGGPRTSPLGLGAFFGGEAQPKAGGETPQLQDSPFPDSLRQTTGREGPMAVQRQLHSSLGSAPG